MDSVEKRSDERITELMNAVRKVEDFVSSHRDESAAMIEKVKSLNNYESLVQIVALKNSQADQNKKIEALEKQVDDFRKMKKTPKATLAHGSNSNTEDLFKWMRTQ